MTAALDYQTLAGLCDRRIGTHDVACPRCGPTWHRPAKRKKRVLRVWHREQGFAIYYCARCRAKGHAHGNGAHRQRQSVDPKRDELRAKQERAEQREAEQKFKRAMALWAEAAPLPGSLGWTYFCQHRDLRIDALGDLSHALRWHQGIRSVIALMTDPVTNAPTGVHRTFLNPDATKRERKMLSKVGVIRLSPDEEVTYGLGIAEGIEKTLAIMIAGRTPPMWCACSASGIAKFPVLSSIDALKIFADDNEVGITAAYECADRWERAGREAFIAELPKDNNNV